MKKVFALILLLCFVSPQLAFAGAWTLPEGDVRLEYSVKTNWAKNDFAANRDLVRKGNDARSWGWTMIPKVEYGVTDWFTVFSSLEYKEAKYKEYARNPAWGPFSVKNHAITNVNLGGKVRILKDPFVLSTQVTGSIYTGYADGSPDDVREQPGLSDRENSIEARLLAGKVFDTEIPFYVGAETGLRCKNRNASNDIPFFAEFGFWATDWLLLKTEIDGYYSLRQDDVLDKDYAIWRIGPIFQLLDLYRALAGEDVSSSGPNGSVTLSENSLNLEVQYGNTFWGKNTSADQEVVVKLSTQF